jgi:type VI secretion system protein ImpL
MKALGRILTARWFLTLLGTTVLALLVWFIGPLLGFAGREPLAAAAVRWWVIAVLFGIWLAVQLVRALRARLRNRRLVDGLTAEEAPPDPAETASEEELAALRERFSSALSVLRGNEGRRRLGGQWVYDLPWYLIIGPPGCGKTTALVSSGLRFPLAEQFGQDAIAGIGGTRNCDWWFTDEAVLLDTAGRYTTQDSYAEVDSAAWRNFLDLLKQYRPRRPLNGVLVALSLADLMTQSAAERDAHARAVRARVQELYTRFNLRLPIYVLFTKADLVAGFTEFFADLGEEGRQQVWGISFPYPEPAGSDALAALPVERGLLNERLDQRLIERMQDERNPQKRRLVFGFPRQFAALGAAMDAFLNAALAPSRFEQRPLVRGVYFTSGTQEGTPIDRVLGAIAADFGVDREGPAPFTGTARSFFVTRLLRDLVFPEAPLAGLDPRLERRRRWLRRGAYAGTGALALLAALAWTSSFSRNHAYVGDMEATVTEIQERIDAMTPEQRDPLGLLPLLDALRALPGGYEDRDRGAPWGMGLGLYQGDKLGSQAQLAYRRVLHRALLPRVILRMEEQIRQVSTEPELLHAALRVYLMLDDCRASPDDLRQVPADCSSHYSADEVQDWVTADWRRNLPRTTTEEEHAALAGHLAALFETQPRPLPLALDGRLIEDARDILRARPRDERLYQQLKDEGVGLDLPDFTIAAAGGQLAPVVLTRPSGRTLTQGIPALFTYDGYHLGFDQSVDRLLQAAAVDAWVLGPEALIEPGGEQAQRLKEKIRERYLRDYIDAWETLLGDIGLVPARDLGHAAEIARILSDSEGSPLRRVLLVAAAETELDRPPPEESASNAKKAGRKTLGVLKKVEGRIGALRRRADRYLGDVIAGDDAGAETDDPANRVSRHFAWLRDLVGAGEGQAAPLDRAQEQLAQFGAHLAAVDQAIKSGRPALAAGDRTEIDAVKQAAAAMPPAVAQMIDGLADDSATLVAGGVRAELNREWGEVLAFCREVTGSRYPFRPGSSQDTTLADFGALFGPGGALDAFFAEKLRGIVDTRQRPWRWADRTIGIPDSVLRQFERAAKIRDAYFQGGGKTPSVAFELTPTAMDAGAMQFILDLGGQVVDYRHGPPQAHQLTWPSPQGIGRARQSFTRVGGTQANATEDGPWGFFRLLDRAAVRSTGQDERFVVTFRGGGMWAKFELRAASIRNPFKQDALRGFECPARL